MTANGRRDRRQAVQMCLAESRETAVCVQGRCSNVYSVFSRAVIYYCIYVALFPLWPGMNRNRITFSVQLSGGLQLHFSPRCTPPPWKIPPDRFESGRFCGALMGKKTTQELLLNTRADHGNVRWGARQPKAPALPFGTEASHACLSILWSNLAGGYEWELCLCFLTVGICILEEPELKGRLF